MGADSDVLREETKDIIQQALASYPGDALHVAVYVAARARDWNDLQTDLARIDDLSSNPKHVSQIRAAVEEHIRTELEIYLTQR